MIWPTRKTAASSGPADYQGDDLGFTNEPPQTAAMVPAGPATIVRERLSGGDRINLSAAALARRWFVPAARFSIFVVYFWFGLLKAINLSPATPLASALVGHTIGLQYFGLSFKALAVYECAVGVLFLIPAMTRVSVVLLAIHMAIVSSPLLLVAQDAWTHPLVPTFEGQYIIKDLALIALAIGILAYTPAGRVQTGTVK